MTVCELIADLQALQAAHGENAPVVIEDRRPTPGGLALVRSVESEVLTKLKPALYARPEVRRFLETVVVIKS
jgi:hypothetical protein